MLNSTTLTPRHERQHGAATTGSERQEKKIQSTGGNHRQVYILYLLMALCTLLYYFGELVNFAGWESLRWSFFYTVHDVHRLFFLAPIVYAGYYFGVRAAMIITVVTFGIFLPRVLFISPYPDPLLRTVLFIVIAGTVGWLTGRESEKRRYLETVARDEGHVLRDMLERMPEGVLIIGPDYRIRFMNATMKRSFGEGTGSYCYKCLHEMDCACHQVCQLPDVISGGSWKQQYTFPDGRAYEMLASPYVDADGTTCQLSIFTPVACNKAPSTSEASLLSLH